MIYRTAYDTTIGSKIQTSKLIQSLQDCAIRDGVDDYELINRSKDSEHDVWFIANGSDNQAYIPFFNHPIIINVSGRNKPIICSDIRTFASFNRNNVGEDDVLRVKNRIELNVAKVRTSLNLMWLEKRPELIRDISNVPMAMFAAWLAEAISKRFALTAIEQARIAVIATRYYFGLFIQRDDISDEEKMRLTAQVMKISRLPEQQVTDIINAMGSNNSIYDFVKNVKLIIDNTRLDTLDVGILINLIITSWFGSNSRELVSVALEHPPTWISLVYSSFIEKSYKNTPISKISQRYLGSKGENDFVRSLVTLMTES